MKSKQEILQEIWDTDKTGWDLQIDISLNSSISKIEDAMDSWAKAVAREAFLGGCLLTDNGYPIDEDNFDQWWSEFKKQYNNNLK